MSRGNRTRLATGIYEDDTGVTIRVSVKGQPRDFQFTATKPPERYRRPLWSLEELRKERLRIKAREIDIADRAEETASTFAADVDRYLKTLSGRTKKDAQRLLAHWKKFNDQRRVDLTAVDLRTHAATWTCAASTFNHRRQVLINLYQTLDGPQATNPAREIPKRPEEQGAPKALSYDVIAKLLKAMPQSQSRARLKLMAYTGLPGAQIAKLTPADWQQTKLRVTPRRKGAGAAGRWIPLSREAQAAMKEFSDTQCWGPFSSHSLYKFWKRHGAPEGSSPYSLRHSWITELYKRSNGDVLAVQQLALHARLEQTKRYAAAALEDRMAALVVPRKRATKKTAKHPKSFKNIHGRKARNQRGM